MEYVKQCEAVERNRQMIFDCEDYIWKHPQLGYREWDAHKYMANAFEGLGYELILAGDIPGFYTDIDTGLPGPHILVMAELDALICEKHPAADPATGAAHACGHHAQCAALLGLAAALKEPGMLDGLCGKIRLCTVPCEESADVPYLEKLKAKGVIRYKSGKNEFMRRGYFDGMDIAFLFHTGGADNTFMIRRGQNGLMCKTVCFAGVAAHAGGAPHKGVNALYAATLGLNAINALRETFRDDDHIRIHPVITKGSLSSNVIPDEVTLEIPLRGANTEALFREAAKVDRALAGSAAAMGATVSIKDDFEYAPLYNEPSLRALAMRAMASIVGETNVNKDLDTDWGTGCTDMGSLAAVMPTIHGVAGGSSGVPHSAGFRITSVESACVNSAKCQLTLLVMLLENGAAAAESIIAAFQPQYSAKADFLAVIAAHERSRELVHMEKSGRITLML